LRVRGKCGSESFDGALKGGNLLRRNEDVSQRLRGNQKGVIGGQLGASLSQCRISENSAMETRDILIPGKSS